MQETYGKDSGLDQFSTSQLEELLRADMESSEDCDPDAIFQILEVIERRENEHPTKAISDTDSAWAEFQQYYNIPEGEGLSLYPCDLPDNKASTSKLRSFRPYRWLKRMGVAVAAVMVLFCGLVVVQAAGIDVFGAIGRWTSDTFHLVSLQSNAISQEDLKNVEYCQTIKDALSVCGIKSELVPTWYPAGFELNKPQILRNKASITVDAVFNSLDDQYFNVTITRYQSPSQLNIISFEKDSAFVEEYESCSRTFYIVSNENINTATWAEGLLLEEISGNLTIDNIKRIIDSIGGK